MELRRLASNTAYLTMDWVIISILSSLFWVVSGKLLVSEELGVVATSYNLASIISILTTLGISNALYKLISEYVGNNKGKAISSLLKSSFRILVTANVIAILIFIGFAQLLSPILKLSPDVIVITGMIVVFLSLSNTLGFAQLGFQRMKAYMTSNAISHAVRFFGAVGFTLIGFAFFGPLIGVVTSLIVLVILRLNVFQHLSFNTNNTNYYKPIFKYATPALIGGLAVLSFNNAPYVILTLIKDLSITGIFTPAMLLATPLFIFPNAFTTAAFPIISGLSSKLKAKTEEKSLIEITFRYAILFTLPLAAFLISFSDQIVLILFKPEYLPAAELLRILVIGALLYGFGSIFINFIYALKRPKVQQNILIAMSITFLVLSIPLTIYLSALGMSIAYLIATSILFLSSYFNVQRLIKISLPYGDIFKILIATTILIGFIAYGKIFAPGLMSIVLFLPGAIIYFVSLLYLKFYNTLDLNALEYLHKVLPFAKNIIAFAISVLRRHVS